MEKRPRGRPKKIEGSMEPWQLGRAVRVLCAYEESRGKGEKHSDGVRHAVEIVKQSSPEMPISETGVKRILSTHRSKESKNILRFECLPFSEEDIKIYNSIREQIAAFAEKEDNTLPRLPVCDTTRRREKFLIRFSERPVYPRSNRKTPKE